MNILFKCFFSCVATFFILSASAQMQFVENKGQWDNHVKFKGDLNGGAFFLENNGFTVLLHNAEDLNNMMDYYHGLTNYKKSLANAGSDKTIANITEKPITPDKPQLLHSHAYKVQFLGANNAALIAPDKIMPNYNNYFVGNDQTKWAGDCRIYQAVTFKNIYPNIDVRYYTSMNQLKYDLIVHPGGNPNAIAMRYDGADKLNIVNKELIVGTSVGEVKELFPYSYQTQIDRKSEVECKYVLTNNVLTFKVKNYDATQTLIIDPAIIFSSLTGSSMENWGYTATPAPDGSVFAGGIVFGSGYPTSSGAFQTSYGGGIADDEIQSGYDIGIFKFSPDGKQRLYATYLGGSGNEQPHSLICDGQGNLIVAGRSSSANFPVKTNTAGLSGTKYDIIITKFNAAGNALLGSVKIGGSGDDGVNIRNKYNKPSGDDETRRNYGDDARSEVILDASGNVWLASCTQSLDFPTANPFQASNKKGLVTQDGVILKFNANLSNLLFSSYFGGTGDDACFVISQNPITGNMYIGGATTSTDLPGNTSGAVTPKYAGGATDGFVTEISNSGTSLIRTTYIGTSGNDLVFGLKFDKFGFPYIMGTTTGTWPVINATFNQPAGKQFICKLQPDLSAYVYSTCFGASTLTPNISPVAFLVDRCQNVYVSGWGGGINPGDGYSNSGTFNMPEVNPLPNIPTQDGKDFFFFVLERDAKSQLFGSHFGEGYVGSLGDHVDGGTSRFDENGVIYQAVCACKNVSPYPPNNPTFPTTPGVWSSTINATDCNEAVVKIQMNFAGVGAAVKAIINGEIDSIGCVPLKITFIDTLSSGKKFIWNYGDNTPNDTTYAPNNSTIHTYNNIGFYKVMMVAIDSSTCNISDTAFVNVKVGNNNVSPDFNFLKLDSCSSLRFQFTNLTTAIKPIYTNQTFTWDFGDGSPKVTMGNGTILHTFPSVGSYKVTLVANDTAFCNSPETITHTVRLNPNVVAAFKTSGIGCIPYSATFKNTSLGGLNWLWEFGDGDTSTLFEPTHVYKTTGTFQVRLIAYDSTTCNKVDSSAYFTITVYPIPIAGFTWIPNPPVQNVITQFTNTSIGASSYMWYFGDGDSSNEVNPAHQYNTTDTFHVILIAFNAAGCPDTFRANVPVIVVPLIAVPNAFTPGKFMSGAYNNGIIKVVGFGLSSFQWKIYNRWGQVVFATTDVTQGWDGTFKGQLQPTDVYTYTLEAKFTSGQLVRKTGDITLLR